MHILKTIQARIVAAGGLLPFDEYMATALYDPENGYYMGTKPKIGILASDGSDFATAPEISPLFGRALARQIAQALVACECDAIWEFGAGRGSLALHILQTLAQEFSHIPLKSYHIVELSGALAQAQRQRLADWPCVRWESALPRTCTGVLIGNEVLDAMPVKLLERHTGTWWERCVGWDATTGLHFVRRASALRPPLSIAGTHNYCCEIHPQAEGFIRTLAATLKRGAAFFIDYGFPEREYYHPDRTMGTLVCHQAHRVDSTDIGPLLNPGERDISSHVNFTGIAMAGQDAGLEVLGYTNQGHFLLNCGLAEDMSNATLPQRSAAHTLIAEHEMGELFKVIGFATPANSFAAKGFDHGDRSATL